MAVNEIMRTELPQYLISLLTNTPHFYPLKFTYLASLAKLMKNVDDEIQHKMFEMGITQALVKLLSFGYDDRKMAKEIVEAISSVVIVGLSKGSTAEPHPYRDILDKNEIRDEVDININAHQQENNKSQQKEKKQSQEDELKRVIDVLYKYGVQKAINESVRSVTSIIIGWLYRSVPIPVRFVPPVDVNFNLNANQQIESGEENDSPIRKKQEEKEKYKSNQKQDDQVLQQQQQKDGMNVVVNLQKTVLDCHCADQINSIVSLSALAEFNHTYIASKPFLSSLSQFILKSDYYQKRSEATALQNTLQLYLRLMQKGNQITQKLVSDAAPHDKIKELANLHLLQNVFIGVSEDLISNAVKLHSWLANMAHMQILAEQKEKIVDKSAEVRRKFIESQEEQKDDDEGDEEQKGDDKNKNDEQKKKMTILTNTFISVSGREDMEGIRYGEEEQYEEENKDKEGEMKNEEDKKLSIQETLVRFLSSKDEIILDRASYSIERELYAGVESEEDIVDDEDEDDENNSDSQDINEKKKEQEETEEQKQKMFQKEVKKMQDFIKKRNYEEVRKDKLSLFRLYISLALEAAGSVGQLVSLFKRCKTLLRTSIIGQIALSLAWIYRGAQFPKQIFLSIQTSEGSLDSNSISNESVSFNAGWIISSQSVSPNILYDVDCGNDAIMHLKQRVKLGVGVEMTEIEKKDENLVKDEFPYFIVNSIAALSLLTECRYNHDLILSNNFKSAIVSIILNEKNSTSNILIYTLQLVNSLIQSGKPTTKSSMKQFEQKKFLDQNSHFVDEGKEVAMMNEQEKNQNQNSQKELISKIALNVQVALLVMKNKKREQISSKLRDSESQKMYKVNTEVLSSSGKDKYQKQEDKSSNQTNEKKQDEEKIEEDKEKKVGNDDN
ncbi:MAG: hypothetical protein EZS28_027374 [Streblomastix strix]|uniref:Uncharacterized protein n=1 Tax=Streblomastix strix TaxID=222440 RepID=A0A5J4V404_9EUKA|nr:MAG: hypothetical protein EZS28_027374 [Streblomastix strix]